MSQVEEVKKIKIKIKVLQEKLISVENKEVKAVMHEGKNIAELQRKSEVRGIRRDLKEKITTLEVINKADVLINGVKENE